MGAKTLEPLFRPSQISPLMVVPRGYGLTSTQAKDLDDLQSRLDKEGKLPAGMAKTLESLKKKRDTPIPLGETGKKYVREVWLQNKKGFRRFVDAKEMEKGKLCEKDAISLISRVDGKMYRKNADRVTSGYLSGESDVIYFPDDIVHDTKCSWDALSFMNAEFESRYEWQLRAYMHLYGVGRAGLRYCLVDCPESVYMKEFSRFCFYHGIVDETLPEYRDEVEQFRRNLIYTDTGLYSEEERVKSFYIDYDKTKNDYMLSRLEMAAEYYHTLTLNNIE